MKHAKKIINSPRLRAIIKEAVRLFANAVYWYSESNYNEGIGYYILRRLKVEIADLFNALHSGHKRPVLELARGFIRAETTTRKYVSLLQILLIIAIVLAIN